MANWRWTSPRVEWRRCVCLQVSSLLSWLVSVVYTPRPYSLALEHPCCNEYSVPYIDVMFLRCHLIPAWFLWQPDRFESFNQLVGISSHESPVEFSGCDQPVEWPHQSNCEFFAAHVIVVIMQQFCACTVDLLYVMWLCHCKSMGFRKWIPFLTIWLVLCNDNSTENSKV